MLEALHIKNYVIIDELMLDFQAGMTVISGETGAGKSIIMDALELAVGARAEAHVIKHGQTRCEITASFDVSKNPAAQKWLFENDFETTSFECIFRRTLTSDGRSRSTINGQMVTIQKTRELAQYLLDIHGQHEHQSLLKSDTHRIQLDEYANHVQQAEDVAKQYKIWQALHMEIENLSSTVSITEEAHKTLLTYQLEELNAAELEEGEATKLNQEHVQLSQVDTWLKNAQGISEILGSDQEMSLRSLLQAALNLLPHAKELPPAWQNLHTILENAAIQCKEAEDETKHILATMEPDPERLQQVEKRLQLLHALSRKHHTTIEDLPQWREKLLTELEVLEKGQEKKLALEKQLMDAEKNYHKIAKILSENRHQQAIKLGEAVTQFIHQLGLVHGKLDVHIESQPQVRSYGYDKVEYYIVMNPSQPPRPLTKVASGGELSRISLAIEVVTTQENYDLTRLFDEVDVGIGGQTAAVVGKLLRTLGEKSQVLCITHQPQTAAQGHQHLFVEKKVIKYENQEVAHFEIRELDHQAKVKEIARMLGGLEMTSNTLAHAQDLLQMT